MKVIIGSDKSGFTLKEAVKAHLLAQGYEVEDGGTLDLDHVKPFFVAAPAVASRVSSGEFERGILICGTGAGMEILANKYKGVYAVLCGDTYDAKMCRAINDANIMTMGGCKLTCDDSALSMPLQMVDTFLTTEFGQDLEPWRQEFLKGAKEKVQAVEQEIYG
ncbi:MAG: RpiB/LacA/LacB family sugar-phosphate isomerase [Clostridiales bacterium]|nr:RpiB/LacA/LacB family sugar-phosphate isomerase [Clostridiales bacterium]